MREIGIGVIGTGFMGKAHAIAYSASASVFGTGLRPVLQIVCDLSPERASQRATDLGFSRYTDKWQMCLRPCCRPHSIARQMIRMLKLPLQR